MGSTAAGLKETLNTPQTALRVCMNALWNMLDKTAVLYEAESNEAFVLMCIYFALCEKISTVVQQHVLHNVHCVSKKVHPFYFCDYSVFQIFSAMFLPYMT